MTRPAALVLGLLVTGLSPSAVALAAPVQTADEADVSSTELRLVVGQHQRVTFELPVIRVAVGDPDTLSWNVLNDRQVLLLPKETGRTTLIGEHRDGTYEQVLVTVQPDLSILERALLEISPTITVERAPDRDALFLRGRVPDITQSRAAEAVALAWLEVGQVEAPLMSSEGMGNPEDLLRVASTAGSRSRATGVINLILVDALPPRVDERIAASLGELMGREISVRRVRAGDLPDDLRDIFVLEGTVENQIDLIRAVTVAAGMLGADPDDLDVEVLADESGALTGVQGSQLTGTAIGGGGNVGGFSGGGQANTLFGNNNQQLFNLIGANLARATVISAANGRLISFLRVEDLPQVRVDVRLYEVNVTSLQNREGEMAALYSDFDQGSLLPAPVSELVQGDEAARVGNNDVQNVMSFLEEGFRNQLQVVGDNYAIDAVLQVLESEGLARSLARPSLTVLSGERAQFQVGGNVPITESFATNNVADGVFNSVSFVPFGIFLDTRPLVGQDDVITIDVMPQVAIPSPDLTALIRETTGTDQATTSFQTRSLRTSTRLLDGEALVIGGLLSQNEQWSDAGTPWLRDIPGLGWFFERDFDQQDETNLVLVLHPVIIREAVPETEQWVFSDPLSVLDAIGGRAEPPSGRWAFADERAVLEALQQPADEAQDDRQKDGTPAAPAAFTP